VARTPDLERRQELLDRIVEYLAEHGLAQATLRPMAASLGVSINRLVHHFGSKEELLATALRRALDQQIAVQAEWLAKNPNMGLTELYRKWWKWMNESPEHLSSIRLNYEAAALDPRATGLTGDVRADQIGVWRHEAEQRLIADGMPPERAAFEASLVKATFTGLVMDLFATNDKRRLNKAFAEFLARIDASLAEYR